MKIIFKSMILCLAFLCQDFRMEAQDCELTDPLYDVENLFDVDLCCGMDFTEFCFDLGGFTIANGATFALTQFENPNGTWTGNLTFTTIEGLVEHMESISDATFIWEQEDNSICTYIPSADPILFGDLFFCKSDVSGNCISNEFEFGHRTEKNVCPIVEPEIDVNTLLDPNTVPENMTIFDGISTLEVEGIEGEPQVIMTNDVINQPPITDTITGDVVGPSNNTVGNLLNMAISSGALEYGAGCFGNLNCVDLPSIATALGTGVAAENINNDADSANDSDMPVGTPPSGDSWADYLSTQIAEDLGDVNLVDLINTNLGLQIPNIPCDDDPIIYDSNETGGKGGSPQKSMTGSPNTQADADYFSSAIPGLGLDGPGAANPSPSALEMIKNVNAGVDLYNGSQSTSLPLYNFQANDISVPISLNSSNNGLKVNDMGSLVGQNWSLNAGGMISRVVNGLPDEFNGTTEGVGVGKHYFLKPMIRIANSVGLKVHFPGAGANPLCAQQSQLIKLGFGPKKQCNNQIYIVPRWTALRPNVVSFIVGVRILQFPPLVPAVSVFLEFGFDVGVSVNEKLGTINFEERGVGFLNANNSTIIDDIGLDNMTGGIAGLGSNDLFDVLKKNHPQKKFDDLKFFQDFAITWDNWISAIFGNDYTEKTKRVDTEPDEFYFNFGGYSGKFMFTGEGDVVTFPHYEGLKIEETIQGANIVSFTVTTPEGMEYTFGKGGTMEGVDVTKNTNYHLPNFFTYQEKGNIQVPLHNEFGEAQIDVAQMPSQPYIGPVKMITYGNTYDRNYKIMEAPSFTSAWHLVEIKSLLSTEVVTLTYDSRELDYYANKGFTHSFPNFGTKDNHFKTKINPDLNPTRLLPTKWENGRAELSYSATQTHLTRSHLLSINGGRGENAHFIYGQKRGEIVNDYAVSRIEIRRNGGALYKGWQLEYTTPTVLESSTDCNNEALVEAAPPAISIEEETTFNLGKLYDIQWFEYHNYFFLNISVGCFTLPIRIPFPFFPNVDHLGHRTQLSEYGSLMEIKALAPGYSYNESFERDIFNAEKKRTFLQRVLEIDKENATHDFVTEIKYNGEGLPKRFSVNQDLFGYFVKNNESGSPFPPLNYTSTSGDPFNNMNSAAPLHFGFQNADGGNIFQGQKEFPSSDAETKLGSLGGLRFASGASVGYTYELNQLPNGELGAGLRVAKIVETPGGSPAKTTTYKYLNPTVINSPIRQSTQSKDYYYKDKELRVTTTSSAQNVVLPNKNAHVGYGEVIEIVGEAGSDNEEGNNIGKIIHYFSTPTDFGSTLGIGDGGGGADGYWVYENKKCELCEDVTVESSTNMPPALEFPENGYKTWLLGVEYRTHVLNKDGSDRQLTNSKFEHVSCASRGQKLGQKAPCSIPDLKYFKSQMYQNNYPGSFLENYAYRKIRESLSGNTGNLIGYLIQLYDLAAGAIIPHPFKQIDRNYFVSDRTMRSGYLRSTGSLTTTIYPDLSTNEVSSSYEYDGLYPFNPNPKQILTNYSDGSGTETENIFVYGQASELGEFSTSAVNFLKNEINYLAPVVSKTSVNGTLSNVSFTALDRVDGIIVPLKNFTARNNDIALAGEFSDYNGDGKPQKYKLVKHGNAGSFAPIELVWNNQLQLTSRKYIDFETTYDYDSDYYELLQVIDPDDIETIYTYDSRGRVETTNGLNGRQKTKYTYNIADGDNYIQTDLELIGPGGHPNQVTTQKIDGFGKPLSTVRENDDVTLSSTTYDQFWRVVLSTNISSGKTCIDHEASPIPMETTITDAVGNVTESKISANSPYFEMSIVKDPNEDTSYIHTSGLGWTMQTISPENSITTYAYNGLGQVTGIENPAGEEYIFEYNDIDQLAYKKIPGAGGKTIWWDKAFRPIGTMDANGNVQVMKHDDYNRLAKIKKVDGGLGSAALALDEGQYEDAGAGILLLNNTYGANTWVNSTSEAIMSGNAANGFNGNKVTFYSKDDIGRPYNIIENHPIGVIITENTFTPAGLVLNTKKNVAGEKFKYGFSYDDVLRPVDTNLGVAGTSINKTISSLEYNGMDLVSKKFLGQVEGDEYLQQIDYAYDAAGKLLQINDKFDMECFVDETICEMEVDLIYPLVPKPDCHILTQIVIDGQIYTAPANFDILVPGTDLAGLIETALDYFGLYGTVSQMNEDLQSGGQTINISVTNTNAGEISLSFQKCGKKTVFEIISCCEDEGTGTPNPVPGQNYTENDDLFFEDITYTGLDITRIDIASDCSTGWMRNDYAYDGNHRVRLQLNAVFNPIRIDHRYNTVHNYDAAGNITSLGRNGWFKDDEDNVHYGAIDQLKYTYATDGDKVLKSVEDTPMNGDLGQFAQPEGFVPKFSEYDYDANGNIAYDSGKELKIEYNLINLPTKVSGDAGEIIFDHTFGAEKVKKEANGEVREYGGGLERVDGQNESYHFGDGRIMWDEDGEAHIQYTIKDHLGNTVVFFEDKNEDGDIITELMSQDPEEREVLQRNHYYPFGMPMKGGWNAATNPAMDYLYNGKENEEELGLNWQAYGFRYYDNAIGRFTGVDPISEQFAWVSTYNYAENKPINHIDLWGLQAFPIHGTNSDPSTFKNMSDASIKDLTGNKTVNRTFSWETKNGFNNDFDNNENDRNKAAKAFAKHVLNNLKEGESITLIGHSHGGNVAIQAINLIRDGLDEIECSGGCADIEINLITIATPAYNGNSDPENPANAGTDSHIHYYSEWDQIQTTGANAMGEKDAGRTYTNSNTTNVKIDDSTTRATKNGRTKVGKRGGIDSHSPHFHEPELIKKQ